MKKCLNKVATKKVKQQEINDSTNALMKILMNEQIDKWIH